MKLPAFDIFRSEVLKNGNESKKLLVKEKKELVKNVSKIDESGRSVMYAILQTYKENEEDFSLNVLSNASVEVDIDKLPILLSRMILLFSRVHLTAMNDNKMNLEKIVDS